MLAVQVTADGDVETVDRPVPEPGPEAVRIAVEACGVCGGERAAIEGGATEYPRIPGHEVAGRVDAVGDRVTGYEQGDRVAVAWHGGHCHGCEACRTGDFVQCRARRITGLHRDGGYAEYTTARREALIRVPDDLPLVAAGPLVCAGLTAYSALRAAEATVGDLVAVQGLGGVGHLGVQFADAMGFETVVLSRGPAKREAAVRLGADHFVDTEARDPAEALQALGGARTILATPPDADAIATVLPGLAPNGTLLAVGAPSEPVPVPVDRMLDERWSVQGWSAGHSGDAEAALEATVRNSVDPVVEEYPLSDAEAAMEARRRGAVRFRAVLVP